MKKKMEHQMGTGLVEGAGRLGFTGFMSVQGKHRVLQPQTGTPKPNPGFSV